MIHLHTHSHFSLQEGVNSPSDLVQAAVNQGMHALALTDHRWLSGAVEFYDACQQADVQPILGLTLDVSMSGMVSPLQMPDMAGRLVLLAMDRSGWRSLCRLSSIALTEPYYPEMRPLPIQSISENNHGLLCLTGGAQGLLNSLVTMGAERTAGEFLSALGDIFTDRFYVELQSHTDEAELWNARIAAIAKRYNTPVVATHTVHYIYPEHARLQHLLTAMRLNENLGSVPEEELAPRNAHFASDQEMRERFINYPTALQATLEIAERCQAVLPLGTHHFPDVSIQEGKNVAQVLREKAYRGAVDRYQLLSDEIQQRLDHELDIIGNSGFAPLFLVMEEIVNFATSEDIPISSRGSAASSLVAHCLGITSPDPMRLNLYFERFLNPARKSPPDIDTDLCSRRRDEVIQYVFDRFGADKVAMVCTINRYRRRSALREVAKAHGLSASMIKTLSDQLPGRWYGPPRTTTPGEHPYEALINSYPDYRELMDLAAEILGSPRHLSIHPGGIVIAPGTITDLIPLQLASKGILISQFDLEGIERFGLVKIDLLGIRGLTVLNDVARKASEIQPVPARPAVVEFLGSIPEDDPETMETVMNGRTIGCFQIESPGMRATLKEIQARTVDDIMVALALYRPGPLTGGLKNAFVRRHRGEEPAEYLHASLEPLLDDTYGVILYQEQVLRIAHELAGLSLSDADLLRRAMSHFDPGQQMVTLMRKFISGALERNQVPADIAERVWEQMAAFAGYGFPKAHAASYAQIAWRSAWCKTHFPAYFMAAVLANWGGYYSQRVYLMEARRLGLTIKPPEIGHAAGEFSVSIIDSQPVLFMGLDQVRELTRRTQRRIQRLRPFRSLADFLARVDPRLVEAQNLAKVGALQAFGPIPALLDQLGVAGWQGGQLALFPDPESRAEDWSVESKAAAQKELLGISVIANPLELKAEQVQQAGALTTIEALAHVGENVCVAGMRQTWRRTHARRGGYIYFMSLEDMEGMLDVIIPGDIYRRFRHEFSGEGPYIVEGVLVSDSNRVEPSLRAERVWRIE